MDSVICSTCTDWAALSMPVPASVISAQRYEAREHQFVAGAVL